MAAPPPPRSLADLPDDVQGVILARVPCRVDRGRMKLVCPAWRAMVNRQVQPPRPLPWLLLRGPSSSSIGSIRACCVLSGGRVHHYIDIEPLHARFVGSHQGGWLLLETVQPCSHIALNVRTGSVIHMPSTVLRRTDPHPYGHYIHGMTFHAAALSASPDDPSCIGVAIATCSRIAEPGAPRSRCIAIWREGFSQAYECGYVMPASDVEDLVYSDGYFIFLTSDESVIYCEHPTTLESDKFLFHGPVRCHPGGRLYEDNVRARYLVPLSEMDVLMVVRFTVLPDDPETSNFRVFKLGFRNEQKAKSDTNFPFEKYPGEWRELDTLGDWILFVGHGCSRFYKTGEYPGFAGIYFMDDGMFYDDSVLFGDGNVRRYSCCDNGKWSAGHVHRFFPRAVSSEHSAPIWLLP